ncbi:MAG TPA: IPTL-CTERM sorting domain-containing protein [Thermoanaerobaculia bacterium]|nr:IPTL-CTERM sorting domain-containing protein [Thermoanaerobaculia bacterium]
MLLVSGLVALGAAPAQAATKEQMHQEMISLAQQMANLKPLRGSDPSAAAQYAAAETRYREISDSMGGDDPGNVISGIGRSAGRVAWRGAPTSPPNCTATTQTFNGNPFAIADVAVSSGTAAVAGAGPWIWDIDLTANITHTFAADMDITITSPGGTTVTLSTDNGAGNDNVFAGTTWDDSANPGGAVPYVTNNGMTTDQAYVNLTVATPLVPEEAMAAFIGEDPNGTWTLTVSDDLGGDTGMVASWSLSITTFPAAPILDTAATFNNTTPTAIADVALSSSTVAVTTAGTALCDVDVTTNITHTFAADMDITLTGPGGQVTTLSTDNGAGNDNVFNGTVWNDDANPGGVLPYVTNNGLATDQAYVNLTLASPLVPEEAMGLFNGSNPNGTWTLSISDDLGGDTGSFTWGVTVQTCSCIPPEADLTLTKTSDAAGTVNPGDTVVYTLTVTNNGPANPATGVTVTDTLPAAVTYVSNDCGAPAAVGQLFTWTIGNLALNASVVCNVSVTVNPIAGQVDNTASVSGDQTELVPADNSSTASFGVGGTLDIPALDEIGLVLLVTALAGAALVALRRRG